MIEFKHLFFLILIPLLIALLFLERWAHKRNRSLITFSSLQFLQKPIFSWTIFFSKAFFYLEYLAFVLIIIALCRPQIGSDTQYKQNKGIDIVLALDISTSMATLDFKPQNRLHAAKQVMENFIEKRPFDRISLVLFAGQSFTQCPLTLDHDILRSLLKKVKFGLIEDGTAIGTALINSGNRLKDSDGKSKIVILLTDGENNRGDISPPIAAKALAALNIKVYTIAVGKSGLQPVPVQGIFGKRIIKQPSQIDEETLKIIANTTKGKFFRAQDPKQLESIYEEINQLEKTKFKEQIYTYYSENYRPLLWIALILLFISLFLRSTRFRKIP